MEGGYSHPGGIDFLDYIGSSLVGKTLHFHCDCLFPIDFTGKVLDYEWSNPEILWVVQDINTQKIQRIGSHHPGMKVVEM